MKKKKKNISRTSQLHISFFSPLKYDYEGMEIDSLPVELTVVWNGDFSIDNPALNKGKVELEFGLENSFHSNVTYLLLSIICLTFSVLIFYNAP